jgi:hypothetical protein
MRRKQKAGKEYNSFAIILRWWSRGGGTTIVAVSDGDRHGPDGGPDVEQLQIVANNETALQHHNQETRAL